MSDKWTKEDLETAAKEFNHIDFDPPIPTGDTTTVEQLENDIKDIVENVLESNDKISEKTTELLELMGLRKQETVEDTEKEEEQKALNQQGGKEKEKDLKAIKKQGFKAKPAITKRNNFVESTIAEGKYTSAQIIAKTLAKFPDQSKGGISTVVSDSKNLKYNKFSKLAKMNPKTKILSFK